MHHVKVAANMSVSSWAVLVKAVTRKYNVRIGLSDCVMDSASSIVNKSSAFPPFFWPESRKAADQLLWQYFLIAHLLLGIIEIVALKRNGFEFTRAALE
jgi:hypothetical protein